MGNPFSSSPYGQTPAPPQGQNQALLGVTPQDYANALLQLGRRAQPSIRTPGALAANLLANALIRHGLNPQAGQQPTPASTSAVTLGPGRNAVQLPSGTLPIGQSGPQPGPGEGTFISSPMSWGGQ